LVPHPRRHGGRSPVKLSSRIWIEGKNQTAPRRSTPSSSRLHGASSTGQSATGSPQLPRFKSRRYSRAPLDLRRSHAPRPSRRSESSNLQALQPLSLTRRNPGPTDVQPRSAPGISRPNHPTPNHEAPWGGQQNSVSGRAATLPISPANPFI